ncbi:MAG: TauD/TfdA dioxygenase family protein [Ilumatobacter sp.]
MQITAASAHVGAFVSDVDLRELDAAAIEQIDAAWAEHGALFFRDQQLSEADHISLAESFADIDINQFFTPVATHPQIAEVRKEPDQEVNVGGGWHTDHSYDDVPARGSILVARDLPSSGGDTRFLCVGAAFDSLSPGLQRTLEGLRAHHTNEHVFGKKAADAYDDDDDRFQNPEGVGGTTHPVVVRHPTTGRKLLYVNAAFTTHFVGWTIEESKPLLTYLFQHVSNGPYSYQFEWQPGSVAMWDNRSTWHWALNDYQGQRRVMHRITVSGEELEQRVSVK